MKKLLLAIVLALLCLFFEVNAQENKAIDITAGGIQIGQQVPDITITNLHNYTDKDGNLATTAKISDFKGKLLILDFWATWCSPCVAMIPKMDSLQKQFGNKVQFLSVTYQQQTEVLSFMEKYQHQKGKHYDLPLITEDKELHKLFPHISLPHYVWIDASGIVIAITNLDAITPVNMLMAAANKKISLARKQDLKVEYDKKSPFLINGNGGNGENLRYHSLFSGFTEGIPSSFYYDKLDLQNPKIRRIVVQNVSLRVLYRFAYSEGKKFFGTNRFLSEVKDPTPIINDKSGNDSNEWIRKYGYSYELILPAISSRRLFNVMQEDLQRVFPQYKASVEVRNVRCMALIRTSQIDKLKSNGSTDTLIKMDPTGCVLKNIKLDHLILKLNEIFLQNYPMPIIDATRYEYNVDMTLDASLGSIDKMNLALEKYDLRFVEKNMDIEMIVVKDALTN